MTRVPKTPSTSLDRLRRALVQVMVDEYLAEERAVLEARREPTPASHDDDRHREGRNASEKNGRPTADGETITMVAALVAGDRWLHADACAVFLGMVTPKGAPNRRGFLERVACRPDFPKQNPITRSWKKSEVDEWAMNQRH